MVIDMFMLLAICQSGREDGKVEAEAYAAAET